PTLSVRLGQPSRRRPIPVAIESSTVEWHSAQVMPTVARWLFGPVTLPITPMTALSFSSSIVTAGSSRFTCPAWMALITSGGSASESTFRPTDNAVFGLMVEMTFCICSVSVHSCSSPNVSKRKIVLPSPDVLLVLEDEGEGGSANASTDPNRPAIPIPAITAVTRLIVISSRASPTTNWTQRLRRPVACAADTEARSTMNLQVDASGDAARVAAPIDAASMETFPGSRDIAAPAGSTLRDLSDSDVSIRSPHRAERNARTSSPAKAGDPADTGLDYSLSVRTAYWIVR